MPWTFDVGGGKHDFVLLPKIINGGIAGIIGVICVFPLDLVKTRLQNQKVGPNGERMYNSILDCFRKSCKAEGYFGMYRGSGVNILLVTPEKAVKFATNDFLRYRLTTEDGKLPVFRQMIAGGAAGLCQATITTPMELLKIQLQGSGNTPPANVPKTGAGGGGALVKVPKLSARGVARELMKTNGITGLYRGVAPTMLRDVIFSMMYFPIFATVDQLGPRKAENVDEAVFYWSFLSGMAAGSISAVAVTPFDVVKTRLQVLKKGAGEQTYTGVADAFVKIMKQEGPRALLKGATVRVIVLAPLFGIVQMIYFFGVAEFLLGIKK